MKTPREIYAQYRIMPNLRLHQLRAAAVAKLLCEHVGEDVNADDVIVACLFHDMGNIIKADFSQFPSAYYEPEGVHHWEKVKAEFIARYGTNHHAANEMIAREIGVSTGALSCIESGSFAALAEVAGAAAPLEKKIFKYSDLRVGPFGVLSMKERLREAGERYKTQRVLLIKDSEFDALMDAADEIEAQIFARADIAPQDITDEAARPLVEALLDYPVRP